MKERELTEKELKKKQSSLDEFKVQRDALKIQIVSMQALIDQDMPNRKAHAELGKMNEQLEIYESNVKVLEKQIKDKKESYLE